MSRLQAILIRVATDLEKLEVRWCLVGALAMAVRGKVRNTSDVDVAISVTGDFEAERIVRTLFDRGYQQHAVLESKPERRLRLVCPGYTSEGGVVDLLFAMTGIEAEITRAAEELEILQGLVLPVATVGHLLAMKVLAWRDQDRMDLGLLLGDASSTDLRLASDALDRIGRRGFGGGEDLHSRLQGILEEKRSPSR